MCTRTEDKRNVDVQTYPNRARPGRAAFPVLTNGHMLPLELKLCLPVPLALAVNWIPTLLRSKLGGWGRWWQGWPGVQTVVTHSIRNERDRGKGRRDRVNQGCQVAKRPDGDLRAYLLHNALLSCPARLPESPGPVSSFGIHDRAQRASQSPPFRYVPPRSAGVVPS